MRPGQGPQLLGPGAGEKRDHHVRAHRLIGLGRRQQPRRLLRRQCLRRAAGGAPRGVDQQGDVVSGSGSAAPSPPVPRTALEPARQPSCQPSSSSSPDPRWCGRSAPRGLPALPISGESIDPRSRKARTKFAVPVDKRTSAMTKANNSLWRSRLCLRCGPGSFRLSLDNQAPVPRSNESATRLNVDQ